MRENLTYGLTRGKGETDGSLRSFSYSTRSDKKRGTQLFGLPFFWCVMYGPTLGDDILPLQGKFSFLDFFLTEGDALGCNYSAPSGLDWNHPSFVSLIEGVALG